MSGTVHLNTYQSVWWLLVFPVLAAVALFAVYSVARWVLAERRQRRADVRLARQRGRALWLEASAAADWQAVQDAVGRVRDRCDEITDTEIASIESRWTA